MRKTKSMSSALKVLDVLDVLFKNFTHGFSNSELAKATGNSTSDITRYVNTLEQAGFAERIPETGRIRVSIRAAQMAVQVMRSIEQAEHKLTETKTRLFK